LPKDPHFLTDEWVCEQPTTPDLFNSTRRTNASLQSYIVTELLRKQPDEIAVLGLAYKPNVDDKFNSPARAIQESLVSNGIVTRVYGPQVEGHEESLEAALDGADGAAVMVNHPEFEDIESTPNQYLPADSFVYGVWGMLDSEKLEIQYDGFGTSSQ
jgi:UDP-N-acetyl-D-mannosaminuronate dehydrogenase